MDLPLSFSFIRLDALVRSIRTGLAFFVFLLFTVTALFFKWWLKNKSQTQATGQRYEHTHSKSYIEKQKGTIVTIAVHHILGLARHPSLNWTGLPLGHPIRTFHGGQFETSGSLWLINPLFWKSESVLERPRILMTSYSNPLKNILAAKSANILFIIMVIRSERVTDCHLIINIWTIPLYGRSVVSKKKKKKIISLS